MPIIKTLFPLSIPGHVQYVLHPTSILRRVPLPGKTTPMTSHKHMTYCLNHAAFNHFYRSPESQQA